jgi:glycosyltransferase involved in cell wall biosynthesis
MANEVMADLDASKRTNIPKQTGKTRRVRLVFLVRVLGIGGAERQLVTLAKALAPQLFEVTVVCLYKGGVFEQELTDSGVRLISLDKKGRWEMFGFLYRLARQLRRLEPDILHPYLTAQNLMAMLMKPILPSTRIVWGVRASNMDAGHRRWLEHRLLRMEAVLSRFTNLIIFNSHAGEAHSLSVGFTCASRVVIPNGTDLSYFSPNFHLGAAIRASWGVANGSMLIGIVGRLDPMKDHTTFLRAAAIFAKSHPDARFVCIGGGPEEYARELQVMSWKLGLGDKVIFLGAFVDMPAAYNALDISCSSSAYGEGTPNCISEAMACGVPCVVTDVGDSRLVVGETGIVVPPRNPEALAAGWTAIAKRIEQSPQIRQLARMRVQLGFGVDALVHKTSEALLNLL